MNIAIVKECKTRSTTGFLDQTIECKGFMLPKLYCKEYDVIVL